MLAQLSITAPGFEALVVCVSIMVTLVYGHTGLIPPLLFAVSWCFKLLLESLCRHATEACCLSVQPHGVSRVQLSKAIYNFTDTQDVRLLLGYRANIDHQGNVVGVSVHSMIVTIVITEHLMCSNSCIELVHRIGAYLS